jgi:hypothetical protein
MAFPIVATSYPMTYIGSYDAFLCGGVGILCIIYVDVDEHHYLHVVCITVT